MLSGNFSSLPVLTDTAVISCFVPFSSVTQKVSLLSDFSPTTFSSGTGVAVGSAVAVGAAVGDGVASAEDEFSAAEQPAQSTSAAQTNANAPVFILLYMG